MATIEERKTKDGKTVYRVKVRMKGYPSTGATFERKTDAKNWAKETETNIRQNRYFNNIEARRHTVAEMIDRYKEEILPQKKSKRDQLRQLEWWKEKIGSYTLADATPSLISEHRSKLKQGIVRSGQTRSAGTVNRYLAALSHVFSVAVREWHWVENNPVTRVSKPKEPQGRVRFLSDEERERLLEACKKSACKSLYPIVVLAISTGARKGELLNLEWQHVDLRVNAIRLVQTKNTDTRALPLAGPALENIKKISKVRRLDSHLVFADENNPTRPIYIEKYWREALKEANVEDFRFHDLRHSAASYLAMNGATLAEIADILGHRTLQMVKRYTHLSEQHTAGVVARMNERIFGDG
jgi:integrase